MKNQYQLNMRMKYSISTQTLYLKKTIDQVKRSRCTLITWDHGKVFTWEWCVTIFVHFQFFGIYSFMRFLVCNQINNGYCYYLFNSTFLLKQKFMNIYSLDKCEWWDYKFSDMFLIGHKSIGQLLHMH